ncbi:MAG: hypothetical protein HRT89_21375, partial [Lentisphaeria bacterium]|nr:hypothetical protein [Lentisphaeria bacterium]
MKFNKQHLSILFVFLCGTLVAEPVYIPVAPERLKIDHTKIELSKEHKRHLSMELTNAAKELGNTKQSTLTQQAALLSIALIINPENKSAKASDLLLSKNIRPKKTQPGMLGEELARYLIKKSKKLYAGKNSESHQIAGFLLFFAGLADIRNEDVIIFSEEKKDALKKVDLKILLKDVKIPVGNTSSSKYVKQTVRGYENSIKPYMRGQSKVNGLVVTMRNYELTGSPLEIIATVQRVANDTKFGVMFSRRGIGPEMNIAMNEAFKAMRVRYPFWAGGTRVSYSFNDKYTPKDGGSAGTAFFLLLCSLLDNIELDQDFAVTGDLTVDWKVRPVGGVPEKILGAQYNDIKYVAIPLENSGDVDDLAIIYGKKSIWNTQIFTIATINQAVDTV